MKVHMYTTYSRFLQRSHSGDGIAAVSLEGVGVAPDANIHIEVEAFEVESVYTREHRGILYREYFLHPVAPQRPDGTKLGYRKWKRERGRVKREFLENFWQSDRFPSTMEWSGDI